MYLFLLSVNDDIETHSRLSVSTVCMVPPLLPGYQCQTNDCGVTHSRKKLEETAEALAPWISTSATTTTREDDGHQQISTTSSNIKRKNTGNVTTNNLCLIPCISEIETWSYRCRCSFQILPLRDSASSTHGGDDGGDCQKFQYAMRHRGKPIPISSFPIANRRIQRAMLEFLEVLNDSASTNNNTLRDNLASISIASSWEDREDADCFITLNYNAPIKDICVWQKQALLVCDCLSLTQLSGRARKQLVRARDNQSIDSNIRDTLWIHGYKNGDSSNEMVWKVNWSEDDHNDTCGGDVARMFRQEIRPVRYEKPEGAFYHPNGRVMLQALEWLLNRVSEIVSSNAGRRLKLLEMYCGCGAHTVALAQSNLLSQIVAVELDERLVEACKVNCQRQSGHDDGHDNDRRPLETTAVPPATTEVEVVSSDAGRWARCSRGGSAENFDILLVDPPRQGLDAQICEMAIHGNFEHFLYISCGRKALVRDLELLSEHFVIVNCTLQDLFPRTDAVESLVHLQRKYEQINNDVK